jgi:hypothetical protein
MRSLIRPLFVAASVLVACGGISGCSGEPESHSGKMDTGNMTGPMDKMEPDKKVDAMDKMEKGKM